MAEKTKKHGGQRYNWNLIMNEYITDSGSSLEKIAKKYGIRLATVKQKSSADNWFATKREYQKKVRQMALQKALPKQAAALAKELSSVDKLSDLIEKMLKDEKQFNRHLVQVSNFSPEEGSLTTTEERIFDKVDARAVKDILQSLKMIEEMKRSMSEVQKVESRQKYELEKARLELEREKFEFEKQKAEFARPDSTNTIRIDGVEKEWTE